MTHFWTQEDFHVFKINGLEERMEALSSRIRPKFTELGDIYSTYFSEKTGREFYPHIAKHARRTVNPPKDSWVAFAPYKRGYKALPHFQIGLWNSHVFVILAVIYEAADKAAMAEKLIQSGAIQDLPEEFMISGDHMKPEAESIESLSEQKVSQLLTRFRDVKKGELVIGRHLPADRAASMTKDEFQKFASDTFETLVPVYETMIK